MEQWMKISFLLSIFGFIKEIRPSDPFLYNFLSGPSKNLTEDDIIKLVFPASTYSNLLFLVIVFLITDMCRYKPLIVLLGFSGIIVSSMVLWTTSLLELVLSQVVQGLFRATEVAYHSYIYAAVDKEHFHRATSHTRGALLAGRSFSGLISQVFISTELLDYKQLNYVTLACIAVATVWALFLPSVKKSSYFHSEDSNGQSLLAKVSSAFILMKSYFVNAYTNTYVLKWSIWLAFSNCGFFQVECYIQSLYSAIQEENSIYNGAIEAILALFGFLVVFSVPYLKFNWQVNGQLFVVIFTFIQGILLLVISQTKYLYLCYIFYVVFSILYFFMVTVASIEIAKEIDDDSYGLIIGFNTFVSLVSNSVLTTAVVSEGVGFALDPRTQFVVYGGFHVVFSLAFIVMFLTTCMMKTNKNIFYIGNKTERNRTR